MAPDRKSPSKQEEAVSDFSLTAQSFRYFEVFLSWLFKYPSRCYMLAKAVRPLTLENPCVALSKFGKSYRARVASKGIICRVTSSQKDIDATCRIFKLIYEEIQDPRQCDLMTAEVIAKVLAYRELKKGDQISLPTLSSDQSVHLSHFVVDKVFDLWNKTSAFGLVSCNQDAGAPLLLFRGTDFSILREGGRASIISDLDPKGPGRSLFETSEKHLENWLKSVSQEKGRARVIGHSLGGVMAAYTLLNQTPYMSTLPHELSYAFNSPGIASELIEKWNAIPLEKRPAYKGFVCRGDVISKFGLLFGDVNEISLQSPLSPIRAHELLLFTEPFCYLHPINLEEENSSASRTFYSKLHQQTASMIYEFGLKFLFPN